MLSVSNWLDLSFYYLINRSTIFRLKNVYRLDVWFDRHAIRDAGS